MIILTTDQASHVRGPTDGGGYLEPRPMLLGKFALPEAVLSDPNHVMHRDYLAALPRRTVLQAEWLLTDLLS